jgi:ABC-type glycerol-3-phosphate transport system substrate-binding protein
MEKYITKLEGNTVIRSTIAFGTADNVSQSSNILSLLMLQNGAKVVSTDRKNALFHIPTTTPSGLRVSPGELALDFFTSFSNPLRVSYTWNASMPQDIDAFGQGRVAMVVAFSDFAAQLAQKYPRFRFETAPVPQNSVTQAPVNLISFSIETVTKTADNTAASFAFLPYYTDQENARSIASASKLTTPFLADLEKQKDTPLVNQILTGKSIFKRSRTQFDASFRQMIIDVSQNGLSNDKALDSAAERINVLLQADNQL